MGNVFQHESSYFRWQRNCLCTNSLINNEVTSPRSLDSEAEDKIVTVVKHFGVFAEAAACTNELCNTATEDQEINRIKEARSSRKIYAGAINAK